jgi:SCF-associated factor 1
MLLLDLPEDVLLLILLDLSPRDHLAFCQVTKAVYATFRQDPVYWRTTTSSTFRLPISPLLAADGPRWYWLYKKLKTQTRLYTWGQGRKGNLARGRVLVQPAVGGRFRGRGRALPHRPIPRQTFQRVSSSWPTEADVPDEVGVIADLQCGGWSTTILTADGKLYTTGSLDSLDGFTVGETSDHFKQLEYLTQATSSIRHFSAGRRHVLALTDDGEVVSWDRINSRGRKIFSRDSQDLGGKTTRVVAGWHNSTAYVPERGILYWETVKNDHGEEELDGLHVSERIIPGTATQYTEQGVITVTKHIALEGFVLWITSNSRIYACQVGGEDQNATEPNYDSFEVPGFSLEVREMKDLQGQFRTFGVFTSSGDVLAGNIEYLRRCVEAIRSDPSIHETGDWSAAGDLTASKPPDVPTLQQSGVIALAYGDHHYHALHSDGRISSHGVDSQCSGQLGLGAPNTGARFRGLHRNAMGRDATLMPIAERQGRHIWFEPEKKDWLDWLETTLKASGFNDNENRPAVRSWDALDKAGMFSEWIEQEGRHWKDGPHTAASLTPNDDRSIEPPSESTTKTDYDDLEPYFALTIAAAGWHSGALVLVDEDKAHAIREKWVIHHDDEDSGPSMPGSFESKGDDEEYVWKQEGFPRVQLPDGTVMPGAGALRPWRDGRPSLAALGITNQGE